MSDLFQLGAALTTLEAGGTLLYPTDTVWGIGCDAVNAEAVAKVLAIKDRTAGEGLIVLVDSIEMLLGYVGYVHPRLQTLLAHHQRPLTMIYPDPDGLAENVLGPGGSAAIRVADDAYCRALIGSFGRPIVSTSANVHGAPTPTHFGAISSEVLRRVDHVAKYRQRDTDSREPSVIARWNEANELEPIRG